MTDWLGVANQLAAANDLSTLIRVFCHTLTNDFNAKRCVFIGVTPVNHNGNLAVMLVMLMHLH